MRPKKSLGQNFLTSQSVVDKIVETANLNSQDVVLEVGPGKGMLTQALLKKAGKVVAVEKDDALIERDLELKARIFIIAIIINSLSRTHLQNKCLLPLIDNEE